MRETIFTDGFTSKASPTGARRGLGLALVRQITERHGGMVSVGRDGGAVFTVVLPGCLDVSATAAEADAVHGRDDAKPLTQPAGGVPS
jgi:two-component system CitB family sensor kinase